MYHTGENGVKAGETLAKIIHECRREFRTQARGKWHEARGKTFLLVTPSPRATCLSPEHRRLQQRYS